MSEHSLRDHLIADGPPAGKCCDPLAPSRLQDVRIAPCVGNLVRSSLRSQTAAAFAQRHGA